MANTTIESGKIDSLTADIKSDLNNLTNGTNFWTGQFKAAVGTAAAPGMTFVGDLDTGIYRAAADTIGFSAGGVGRMLLSTTALTPVTSDGLALGSTSLMWSDGFFASGAVLNFNNGNVTLTHSAGALALGGSAADVVLDLSNEAAGQIKFPATQNPSANANTQDDYEEGTWTPTVNWSTPGDLSVTYLTQVGKYTKIGNLVVLTYAIVTATFIYSTSSGVLLLGGLPFSYPDNNNSSAVARYRGITKAGFTTFAATPGAAGTTATIQGSGSGQTVTNVATADVPTTSSVQLWGTINILAA